MTRVADLIALLAARGQASILHDRRTGFPYSWSAWLRGCAASAPSAFSAADAAAAAPRPPAVPAGGTLLPFPRALLYVLRWAGGDPPRSDQRRIRAVSALCSAALHLLFALLLVWVALVRSHPPAGEAAGERVQVQYVGRGTPLDEGGGAPAAGAAAPAQERAASSAPAAAAAPPAQPPASASASAVAVAGTDTPVPQDPAAAEPQAMAEQPLQVTDVPRPTTSFVLPQPSVEPAPLAMRELEVRERPVAPVLPSPVPTRAVPMREVAPRAPAMPQVQVRERQVEVPQPSPVVMAQVRPREPDLRLTRPQPTVRERQIETAPRQDVAMATLPEREDSLRIGAKDITVRERTLPAVAGKAAAPAPLAGVAQATDGRGQAATPATEAARDPGRSPGAGPRAQDRSGGWATPQRSDDWGAAERNVAGDSGAAAAQGPGLFNADGSVRLAGEGDRQEGPPATRGAPGSDADGWSREQIDRAGTWLKRPPYDHAPTSFDKYWVPNESLLAEWVRKGIKSIEIPIPGTGTRISCVVSILQFGGGCGLSDPNMQEQKAGARPPPDIPFKKELQDDNGSR
ncbi:hypothetical protein [Stenotrophomonas mori]|uniref:hypothetical protein n=1 Tax=Stenotrophomonas mori TaxID=2871096 RepID=UPI00201FD452